MLVCGQSELKEETWGGHTSVKPAQVFGLQLLRDNVLCKHSIFLDFHLIQIQLFNVSSLNHTIVRVKKKPLKSNKHHVTETLH